MSVFLSPVGGAGAQFFNQNGTPLSGGKLYTYAAGTTTPQVTYTSSAGSTQHSNPIVLDAAGRVPGSSEIWLADNAIYKFVLKDSNDVLQATWDQITGINSNFVNYTTETEVQTATAGQTVFTLTTVTYQPGTGNLTVFVDGVNQYEGTSYIETDSTTVTFTVGLHVGALVKFTTATQATGNATPASVVSYTGFKNQSGVVQDLSGNDGADWIGFESAGTGAVARSAQDKMRDIISVKDFGAVGNGVADDTVAIQAAIDYANGKAVFFPNGIYKITTAIQAAPNGINVFGDRDAEIVAAIPGSVTGVNSSIFTQQFDPVAGVLDTATFTVKGLILNGDNTATTLLICQKAVECVIQNCELVNSAGNGIQTFVDVTNITIDNNDIHEILYNGVSILSEAAGEYKRGVKSLGKGFITNNRVYNCAQQNGILVAFAEQEFVIDNNQVWNIGDIGIEIGGGTGGDFGSRYMVVSNNIVVNCSNYLTGGAAILIRDSRHVRGDGNIVRNTKNDGVQIVQASFDVVFNCTIMNAFRNGFFVDASYDVRGEISVTSCGVYNAVVTASEDVRLKIMDSSIDKAPYYVDSYNPIADIRLDISTLVFPVFAGNFAFTSQTTSYTGTTVNCAISINAATDVITVDSAFYAAVSTGSAITIVRSGKPTPAGTLPELDGYSSDDPYLQEGEKYWVIKLGTANQIKIASTPALATAGTPIEFLTAGSGLYAWYVSPAPGVISNNTLYAETFQSTGNGTGLKLTSPNGLVTKTVTINNSGVLTLI